MRIAFYAPLKSPNHPVVSGDREMARLLMRALQLAGHTVEIASELRAYLPDPEESRLEQLAAEAAAERDRLLATWQRGGPDLWFTYHPYYKSPDLIGPAVARKLGIPLVTAEASHSPRRAVGAWAATQAATVEAVSAARQNLCLTRRDLEGLARAVPTAPLAMFPPFIDVAPFAADPAGGSIPTLITVAMMRHGDKLQSYRMLSDALRLLEDMPWRLVVVGDGPARDEVREAFAWAGGERVEWQGARGRDEVARALAGGDIFAWPGIGEAFGLAYLEAAAAGLPAVAMDAGGVAEVVKDGETGLLVPKGDVTAYAGALRRLIGDAAGRKELGRRGRRFVHAERSLSAAAERLAALLPQPAAALS